MVDPFAKPGWLQKAECDTLAAKLAVAKSTNEHLREGMTNPADRNRPLPTAAQSYFKPVIEMSLLPEPRTHRQPLCLHILMGNMLDTDTPPLLQLIDGHDDCSTAYQCKYWERRKCAEP